MKKKTLTLLALSALFLAGCQGNSGKNSVVSKPSETPEASEKPTSSKPSKATETPKPSTSEKTEESSVSPSADFTSKWPSKAKEFFQQHLGGTIIPYINLGTAKLDFSTVQPSTKNNYEDYHIEVMGTTNYSESLATTFKATYLQAGYTVTTTPKQVVAKKDEDHLKVTLSPDSDNTYAILSAYFDEPYNLAGFAAWPSDLLSTFEGVFGTLASNIPPVYLGTNNPEQENVNTDQDTLVIRGWKWNDQILTDAIAILTQAGFDTTGSSAALVKATKTFSDNYSLDIQIEKYTDGGAHNYPRRTIKRKEPFDSDSFTAWPQQILDRLPEYFDGHDLPVFYLASSNPSIYDWDKDNSQFILKGGDWNDEIITLAKAKLTAAGYSENTAATNPSTWKKALVRNKQESDGCKLTISIYCDKSDTARAKIVCDPGFGTPSALSEWSQDIKDAFTKWCNGIYPPAIYLGKKTYTGYCKENSVEIRGAKWDEKVLTNARTVLKEKGWTETSSSGSSTLTRKSPVDTTNYVTWKVKIYQSSGKVDCVFTRTEEYNPNPTATAYPQKVLDDFNTYLNGEDIPYVYLGKEEPTSSYSEYLKTLKVKGGSWNGAIITTATSKYTAAGWTKSADSTSKSVIFTKKDTKGYFYVNIYKDDDGVACMDIRYLNWTTETDYPAPIKDQITARTDGKATLPFVFLGEDSALKANAGTSSLSIYGNVKYNVVLSSLFTQTYAASGWKVSKSTDSVSATKIDSGYKFVATLKEAWNSDTSTSYASIALDVTKPYNFADQATRTYTEEQKTLISNALGGNEIPVLYLGTKEPTIRAGTNNDTSYQSAVTIKGNTWNDKRLKDNKSLLKAKGFNVFTTDESKENGVGYGASLQGYKALGTSAEDGYIRFILTRDEYEKSAGNAMAVFFYDAPTTFVSESQATTKWNEDVDNVELRKNNLGGFVLPYFDFGTVERDEDYFGGGIEITGTLPSGAKSAQTYIRNAVETLQTSLGKTLTLEDDFDYSYNKKGRYGNWTTTANDGNKLSFEFRASSNSISLTVGYEEVFNPSAASAWTDDTKQARTEKLGGHVIPYFYLGSADPFCYTGTNRVTLRVSVWDDQIFDLCQKALTGDSVTWAITHADGDDTLTATHTFDNGTITIEVTNDYETPVCEIAFTPKAA